MIKYSIIKRLLFSLLLINIIYGCTNQNKTEFIIGYFFPNVMHGITFINKQEHVYLFRLGYLNRQNEYKANFSHHRHLLDDESGQKYGASSPDYSYNKNGFTTDKGNIIWLEWSKLEDGTGAVGKIYTEKKDTIVVEAFQAWPELPKIYYQPVKNGISGGKSPVCKNTVWKFCSLNKAAEFTVATKKGRDKLSGLIAEKANVFSNSTRYSNVASAFAISGPEPLYFYSGSGDLNFTGEDIEERLQKKKKIYQNSRFKLNTPFGEIWEAVSNHLNHSRVYGTQTKHIGYVVNRGEQWCKFHDQRLFCWDTFFHAMLASLEDAEGAKESVRAILTHQTSIGIVPNNTIGNDTTRNSNDRTQYPVGALCVWKMHKFQPDSDFLAEVYPKLLKWHNWWFDIRPSNGLPYRDGNKNGLLEWGSELGTLQAAKYESGFDNSPMFDDVRMNTESRTMEMDMVGLSAAWAMDAIYLSYIAEELGYNEDAKKLMQDAERMNTNINKMLWNDEIGMYCNKYWDEYSRKPKVGDFEQIDKNIFPDGIVMSYTDKKGILVEKNVGSLSLTQEEVDYFVRNNIPVEFTANFCPKSSNLYFFYTPEENGVLLKVNNKELIDNRKYWITEFISEPVDLEKGKQYELKMTYTGDIPFEILWSQEVKHSGSLFSERLTPMLFYPFISGTPDSIKASKMLDNLLDTSLFWGDYVIPTVSRNDPSFPEQGYWRGRVWPPTNYLLYLGLKNYAADEVVADFVLKSAKMAQNEWIKHGNLHENYSAITGKGVGTASYCWGGLMQFMLLEELIGINDKGEGKQNPAITGGYDIINFP